MIINKLIRKLTTNKSEKEIDPGPSGLLNNPKLKGKTERKKKKQG